MTLKNSNNWNTVNSINPNNLNELLIKRGIKDIDRYLNPKLIDIPTHHQLYGAIESAKAIVSAAKEGKKIIIHGDFDSDGVCATAILWDFIYNELAKHLGIKIDVLPYIPSRVDEGYGLSDQSIDAMIDMGAQLIITVDCGIRDRERIERYITNELQIIVTDHHEPPYDIVDAKYPIVHPMFPKHEYPFQTICGSAVAFLLTNAIREEVGIASTINEDSKGLDLVGIATVTDLMPLVDINRIFVKYAIEQIKKSPRPGLASLLSLAGVDINTLDSYHFGFVIGPRLNAAGRIGHAMDSLKVILAPTIAKSMEYSNKIHNLNIKRQESTVEMLNQALALIPEFEDENLIFIYGTNWHEGVIGLVAGKIFEQTGKPTIVATHTGKEIKASARSISMFNITTALEANSKHLIKYGGHAQAAGFSIKLDSVDEFKKDILKYAKENIKKEDLIKTIDIDIVADVNDITEKLYNDIENLKPFGYGNQKPNIMIPNAKVVEKKIMSGGKHMKLTLRQNQDTITSIMFNCDEDIDQIEVGSSIDIVSNITSNTWNGNTNIELLIKYYRYGDCTIL